MKKIFLISIIAAALIAVLTAAYFFYYKISTQQKSERFLSSYNKAIALSSLFGKEDETIARLKEALSLAPNAGTSANITLMMAFELYIRNRGSDRVEAINLFKNLIKDSNLSVQRRAAALNGLALIVFNYGIDDEFVKKYLFNDEPYAGYFSQAGGDSRRAVQRILEEADKLHPSALSKISIAFMLATNLFDHGKTAPEFSKENTARLIEKYIADSAAIPDDPNFRYNNALKLVMLNYRAVALFVSNRELNNIAQNDIDSAYKQVVDAADFNSSDSRSKILSKFARFNYAVYLADTSLNLRKGDILLLLGEIASGDEPRYQNFYRYLGVIANYPSDSLLKIATVKLANLSPDFRLFLIRHGWSF